MEAMCKQLGAWQVKDSEANAEHSALARQIGELENTRERLLCEKEAMAVALDVELDPRRGVRCFVTRPCCIVGRAARGSKT